MDFKTDYPDFGPIEEYIRRARLERSVYLGHLVADFVAASTRGLKRLAASMGDGLAADRERRAIQADAFLQRSVPRY